MITPTLNQTAGVWINRASDQEDHYIQAIFPKENHSDLSHRSNCQELIRRGNLQPEYADYLLPDQRTWDQQQRYHYVHVLTSPDARNIIY
jgi:hypothetical protein